MNAPSSTSRTIVVDASVAIQVVLPTVLEIDVLDPLRRWVIDGIRLVAPMLWLAECSSAVRGLVHARHLTVDEGRRTLDDLLGLEVETLPMTIDQTKAAFAWAERLGQRRAYDGFYLALAEELQAELWSMDRRLVNGARQIGVSWIHSVGEFVQ